MTTGQSKHPLFGSMYAESTGVISYLQQVNAEGNDLSWACSVKKRPRAVAASSEPAVGTP